MKLQGKVTCRFLSRITNHSNLLTDEAHAKVMHVVPLDNTAMFLSHRMCFDFQQNIYSMRAFHSFHWVHSGLQVSDEKRKMVMGDYIDQKNAMELAIASGKSVLLTGPQAAAFNSMRMNCTLPGVQLPAIDGTRALPSTFPLHVRNALPFNAFFCKHFCNILHMCVRLR